jgi:glycosyltransferase involved in cell wall biosynthesis
MRLTYALLWSRLGRQADREQSVQTAAALARLGVGVTLLMPQGAGDPTLDAADLRAWFAVEGDFRLIQRPTRWTGERLVPSAIWLGQAMASAQAAAGDLFYSRIPVAFAIGARAPVPFAVEHYRPWPDRLPPIRPLVRRTAASPRCLGFILHSEFAASSFRRAGIGEDRLLVAHNGAEPPSALDKAAARAAIGLSDDRPIALYAGRINARKGLDQLLLVADLRPEMLFLLVGSEGDGPIERAAAARPNVRILPWQEQKRLAAFLRAADILVIPPSSAPLTRFGDCVLPIKTFAYLAAGRPILAPRSPDTAELLRHDDNAWLVPPDDPAAAAAALALLAGDIALAGRLGAAAAGLAGTLSWDNRAAKIAAFLDRRLAEIRSPAGRG